MNKKIHSLALLVNLGIYGVALPALADDNTASAQHEDTMVITAAEQNLQAPGVSTITADEIRKNPPARDVAEIIRTSRFYGYLMSALPTARALRYCKCK